MGALVDHIKRVLNSDPALKATYSANDALDDEKEAIPERSLLSDIFQRTTDPLSTEAFESFEKAANQIGEQLKHFSPVTTPLGIEQADCLIEDFFKILSKDREWQDLLEGITPTQQSNFEYDIRYAFIKKITTILLDQGRISAELAAFLCLVTESKKKFEQEMLESRDRQVKEIQTLNLENRYSRKELELRTERINDERKYRERQISIDRLKNIQKKIARAIYPTACYFEKGSDIRASFGHIAIGELIENDLILSAAPPPINKSRKDLLQYINGLPISPAHNAFLVAGNGFNLILYTAADEIDIESAHFKSTMETQVRNYKDLHHQPSPVLVKKGGHFYIWGEKTPNQWELTQLTALNSEEKEQFEGLFPKKTHRISYIMDGDPRLTPLVERVKSSHIAVSNLYYLDRQAPNIFIPIKTTTEQLELFKKECALEPLSAQEKSRCVLSSIPPEKALAFGKILQPIDKSVKIFNRYLTYGNDEISREVGIGSNSNFIDEYGFYGPPHFITLPPCSEEVFDQAAQDFSKKNTHDYNLLWRNCATSVADFMKITEHLPSDEWILDPTPLACANRSLSTALKDLSAARFDIKNNANLTNQEKICQLLENHLHQLELQKEWDIINGHGSEKKTKKIALVRELISSFRASQKLDMNNLDQLMKASKVISSKNAEDNEKIKECINHFPNEVLPADLTQRKKKFLCLLHENFKKEWLRLNPSQILPKNRSLFALRNLLTQADQMSSFFESLSPVQIHILFENCNQLLSDQAFQTKDMGNWQQIAKSVISDALFSIDNAFATQAQPQEKASDITVESNATFPNIAPIKQHAAFPQPKNALDPKIWYAMREEGNGAQYKYLKENSTEAKQAIKTLFNPPSNHPVCSIKKLPPLEPGNLRLSTHTLPIIKKDDTAASEDLRFGLVEKCLDPGKKVRSRVIVPGQKQLSEESWLYIIDMQIVASEKMIGKKVSAMTIHSLNYKDLDPLTVPLEAREKSYIQYCLAMNIACRVKNGNQVFTLSKDLLQRLTSTFDSQEIKQKILDGRHQKNEGLTHTHSPLQKRFD